MPHRPIHQVMRPDAFVTVGAHLPVRKVIHKMASHRLSAALVIEHRVLVGIFSEHDAVYRVLEPGLDPDTTQVGEVMTHNPQTIQGDRPFGHALHMMYEGGFRHLPVVDSNLHPIGMVSSKDALSFDALDFGKELERREEITVILG